MTTTTIARTFTIEVYAAEPDIDLTNCSFEFGVRLPQLFGPQPVVIEHGPRPAAVGLWRIVPEPGA